MAENVWWSCVIIVVRVCTEYGPDVKYSVSPPRMLVSRAGTMSSRLSLLLTSANAASVFACVASHPTLAGRVGRETVQFMLPSGAVDLTEAQGLSVLHC